MRVSLVSTVFQEVASITDFLESVMRQTRKPDEVIIADAGSTDGTVQIMEEFQRVLPLQIIVVPGANRSVGRNAAIGCATGEAIACADAGCRLDEGWLEKIVAPLEAGAEVVGGYYKADARGVMEQAVAYATIPSEREVNPETFLPSSRSVAFTKSLWEAAGKYPEHLSHNEDTAFSIALRRASGKFVLEPKAVVFWRPRGNLFKVFVQFFRYAYGDGQCGFWFRHYAKAYLVEVVLLALFAAGFSHLAAWVVMGALAVAYEARYAARSARRGARLPAAALAGPVMCVVDAAHVLGYLPGSVSRLFRRSR